MRAEPAFRSSFLFVSMSSILGSGCLLNANAYDTGGGTSTSTSTSTSSTTGGTGGTTMSTGGSATGGTTGGTGGMSTTSSGGTGGVGGATGGTGGSALPTSCQKALDAGMTQSGVVMIDPDTESLPEPAVEVYCDQKNMGGGWALVYTSVGDMAGGTTMFWNIPYDKRLEIVDPNGAPSLEKNYYAGRLYKYGTEYRDDIVDTLNVEAIGVVHGKATSIDQTTMHFMSPAKQPTNLSDDVYYSQFAGGWGAAGYDYDSDVNQDCYSKWANVTQHYGGCWYYSLGADLALTGNPPDHTDSGWGPHISNATLAKINMALGMVGKPPLTPEGDPNPGLSTRLKRISRFARW